MQSISAFPCPAGLTVILFFFFQRLRHVCHYTEEELKYAKALYDSVEMKSDKLPGDATEDSSDIYEYVDEKSKHGTTPMNEFLVQYLYYEKPRMGSTDVGDVSWCIPTAQINTSTFPAQAPGHSWQNVSCGRTM